MYIDTEGNLFLNASSVRDLPVQEILINLLMRAVEEGSIRDVVEQMHWINREDDFGRHHGNLVQLFPLYADPIGNVQRVEYLGHVLNAGESGWEYVVAATVYVQSPNKKQAQAYLQQETRWFIPQANIKPVSITFSKPKTKLHLDEPSTA